MQFTLIYSIKHFNHFKVILYTWSIFSYKNNYKGFKILFRKYIVILEIIILKTTFYKTKFIQNKKTFTIIQCKLLEKIKSYLPCSLHSINPNNHIIIQKPIITKTIYKYQMKFNSNYYKIMFTWCPCPFYDHHYFFSK